MIFIKKIEQFLHAYYFLNDEKSVQKYLLSLLNYADYANGKALEMQQEIFQTN